jgi:predicted DNA-binding WGR domain protein
MDDNDLRRYFELKDEKSSKFWEISQEFNKVTVRYGKIGTNGQIKTTEFSDDNSATMHYANLVAEKVRKGYVELSDSIAEDATNISVKPTKKTIIKKPTARNLAPTNPAKDANTKPESLLALLDKDNETNRLLAKHPNASDELLEKLSHSSDKATRKAVAANPSTPLVTYVKLGQQFPEEFLVNPILDLLFLENPALLHELPESLLVQVLRKDGCPDAFIRWAAGHRSEKVQLAAIMNPRIPKVALEELKSSQYELVRGGLSFDTKEMSVEDAEAIFREEVRKRLNALSISEALEAWSQKDIGLPQWSNLSLPARLAVSGINFYLHSWGIGSKMKVDFAPSEEMAEIFIALAEKSRDQRLRLASVEALLGSFFVVSRFDIDDAWIVENEEASKAILDKLLQLAEKEFSKSTSTSSKADISVEKLKVWARSVREIDRSNAARNPNTPKELLNDLLHDKRPWVRLYAATNSSVSSEQAEAVLFELIDEKNEMLRGAVARNSRASAESLERLAGNGTIHDLLSLLVNPTISSALEERIFRSLEDSRYNPWFIRKLDAVQIEIKRAIDSKDITHFQGKEPSKTVLSKRPLASVMALCAGPYIEPSRLARLVGSTDWLVRAGIAKNQGTPPNLLHKLREDTNPVVAVLAQREHPRREQSGESGVCQVDSFSLGRASAEVLNRVRLLVRDPDYAFVHAVLDEVWGRSASVGEVLMALRVVGVLDEVLNLAMRELGEDQLGQIWNSGASVSDVGVRKSVAQRICFPSSAIDRLTKDKNIEVLLIALSNPAFPRPELIRQLLSLRGNTVKELCEHLKVPVEFLEEKAKSGAYQRLVAGNSSTPASVLEYLSSVKDKDVRNAVAENRSTPVAVLVSMFRMNDVEINKSLAVNANIPVWMLEELSKNKDDWVLYGVAGNLSTPSGILENLSKKRNREVRRCVAENEVTPKSVLGELSKDSGFVRFGVAFNSSAPMTALEELSNDKDYDIRAGVAANASSPVHLLEKLSSDPDKWVRRAVAANPNTPDYVLEVLSRDIDYAVRAKVAHNSSATIAALKVLSNDAKKWIRVIAKKRFFALTNLWRIDLQKCLDRLRRAIACELNAQANGSIPSTSDVSSGDLLRALEWLECIDSGANNRDLTRVSRSKDWLTRLGAALHPNASKGILELLSKDSDPDVAAAANNSLAT